MTRRRSFVVVVAGVLATSACQPSPYARKESGLMTVPTGGPTGELTIEKANGSPGDLIQGFVASMGELAGRVLNADGQPVANAPVQLVTKDGERTLRTDDQGRFKTVIVEPTMVVVYGGMQVTGGSATTEQVDGNEAVVLREAERPAKLAKPLSDPAAIPDYTNAIRDKNAWARAWLLLEVSETGHVARVKLLNPPGYDLDAIAVRDAFKLEFEPARNRVDKPLSSLVVWKFDWPPAVWNHGDTRLRPNASKLPCRRSAAESWYEMDKPYRDCSQPNMATAVTTPWIDRPR